MFKIFIVIILFGNSIYSVLAGEISNLSEPVSYFGGRYTELDNLRHDLFYYKKASIVGVSGIGKTQLIRKLVQNSDYQITWFFDCDRDLDAQYLEFAKYINQNTKDKNLFINEDYENIKETVLDYLKPKRNWLLVYDNLKLGQNQLVKEILELEANGNIIIASQDGSGLPNITYLQPIAEKESLKIISKILPDSKDAIYLNNIFKGYPLLMARGAILVRNSSYTSKDYKQLSFEQDASIKSYIELLIKNLNSTEKALLYKIAVINNQSFSRNFLEKVTDNKEQFIRDLDRLIHLGLISKVTNFENNEIFEMHEAIKEQLIASARSIKDTINDLITIISKMMPKSSSDRYLIFTNDQTIIPSFERLLFNAELYKIKESKILDIREKLISFYVAQRDFIKCKKMAEWLSSYEESYWYRWLMTAEDKAIYASYLNRISMYEEWCNGNIVKAINLKNKAKNILLNIKNYHEHKFSLFVQLAQLYVDINNIDEADKNLTIAQRYIQNDSNQNIIKFIRARILLSQGRFNEVLDTINSMKNSKGGTLTLNSLTAPAFIVKTRALNLLNRPQESFNVLNELYLFEKDKNQYSDVLIFTLIELAQTHLILKDTNTAYVHVMKAKNLFLGYHKNSHNILTSQNDLLPPILKTEADCLSALGNHDHALTNYAQAEAIYYNIYRENMRNNPVISSLYFNAASAACKIKNKFWFNKFKRGHLAKFGLDHPKSKQIQAMQCF